MKLHSDGWNRVNSTKNLHNANQGGLIPHLPIVILTRLVLLCLVDHSFSLLLKIII